MAVLGLRFCFNHSIKSDQKITEYKNQLFLTRCLYPRKAVLWSDERVNFQLNHLHQCHKSTSTALVFLNMNSTSFSGTTMIHVKADRIAPYNE